MISIRNQGAEPLTISDIGQIEGENEFDLIGWSGQSVVLATNETLSIGFRYRASALGLQRGIFEVLTNDPAHPTLRIGATGTGLDAEGTQVARIGSDYVAVEVDDPPVVRARTDGKGKFNFILKPDGRYHIAIYDPETDLVANGYGKTAPSGGRGSLTNTLVYLASKAPDGDFDGLPDDVEFAIGTGTTLLDTDGDGIDDFAEIRQGLDPLDGRAYPTGIIAALELNGTSKAVAVEGSTAYVATGGNGLAVVDVSQFNNPILLGELDLVGDAVDVAVDAAHAIAIVAAGDGGTHFVDVSDSMLPRLRESFSLAASEVEIADGLAYIAEGTHLHVLDIVTGDELQTLTLPGTGEVSAMARDGNTLYALIDGSDTFVSIDIANEGQAAVLGQTQISGELQFADATLFAGNGVAFLAANDLIRVNVSNPSAPVIETKAPVISANGVALNGSGLALAATRLAGLGVYNAASADLANGFLFAVGTTSSLTSVAIASGIAFVTDDRFGLEVINYLGFDAAGQAPSVTISTSAADASSGVPGVQVAKGSTVPVRADVVDDVQIRSVDLLVNGTVVQSDVSFPFDFFAVAVDGGAGSMTLQLRATDTGGNATLSSPLVLGLVPDTTPPSLVRVDPANNTSFRQDEGRQSVRWVFSEPIAAASVTAANFKLRDATGNFVSPLDLELRGDDRIMQATYPFFTPGSHQAIMHSAGVLDRAGNALGTSDRTTQFFVIADTTPPSISRTKPATGSSELEGISLVEVEFSEPMAAETLTPATIELRTAAGVLVPPITFSRLDDNRLARLSFTPLHAGDYQLRLAAPSIRDRAGNPLGAAIVVRSFTLRARGTTLFSGQVYPTADNPEDVATADFNGDNFPDVVTLSSGIISVLLGFGDGTLTAHAEFPIGASVGSDALAVGDVNGDGAADVVVLGRNQKVGVLLGQGNGTFAASQTSLLGSNRFDSLALGDLDGDGDLDLVAGSYTQGIGFSVFLGNGSGAFGLGTPIALAGKVRALALADADGDGDLDIMIASVFFGDTADYSVIVLPNNGNATFAAATSTSLQFEPFSLATGDLDGDGDLDIATGHYNCGGQPSGCVVVLMGGGGGSFVPNGIYALTGAPSDNDTQLQIADLDGDGHRDIAAATSSSRQVSVLYGFGDGTFGERHDYPAGGAETISVVDLDRDGRLDIVGSAPGANAVVVLPSLGNRQFDIETPLLVPRGVTQTSLTLGDLDGDGDLDAVMPNDVAFPPRLTVLTNDGSGLQGVARPLEPSIQSVTLGDVNGDGRPDVVSGGAEGNNHVVTVRLAQADGAFGGPTSYVYASTELSVASLNLVLGDVDNDGDLDIMVSEYRYAGGSLAVLLGNGDGRFAPPLTVPNSSGRLALAAADIDRDGKLDIVTANGADLSFFHGNGDGTFAAPTNFGSGLFSPRFLAIGDFDADGDLDVASNSFSYLAVFRGNGDGTFAGPVLQSSIPFTLPATVGDVDGDSDLDLVFANYGASIPLLLNDGAGAFARSDFGLVGDFQASLVKLGDMDADGDLDIVAVDPSYQRNIVRVLLSDGAGGFTASSDYTGVESARFLHVADLDGDGALDVFLAGIEHFAVLRGAGDGSLQSLRKDVTPGGFGLRGVVLADFDGDSDLDLAVAQYSASHNNKVTVYLGGGDGSFDAGTDFPVAERRRDMAVGDLDQDGDLDLITIGDLGYGNVNRLTVLLGHGDGSFANETDVPLTDAVFIQPSFAIGDLNGDSDPDVVIATFTPNAAGFSVLLGGPGATFTQGPAVTVGGFNTPQFALGDLNGDGRLDLVISGFGDSSVVVRLGIGNGTFGPAAQFAVGSGFTNPALADLDGDGKLDIVTANGSSGTATVLRGAGDGTFLNRTDITTAGQANSVVAADIDRDGDTDLIFAEFPPSGSSGFDLLTVRLNRRIAAGSPSSAPSPPAPNDAAAPAAQPGANVVIARHVDEVIAAMAHAPAHWLAAQHALGGSNREPTSWVIRSLRAVRRPREVAGQAADPAGGQANPPRRHHS